ncbi:MAG: SpoIID/LytB domain-containing protein [Leptospiraceae bacterium]|nr:SpoIID/LytB domain-containing protein [Leptospiraceae bacterium]
MRRVILILTILAGIILAACSAPKKWQGSPYVATGPAQVANGSWDFSEFKPGIILPSAQKEVKVLLYTGKAATISSNGYRFKYGASEKRGSGNFKPDRPGTYLPDDGRFTFGGKTYPGKLVILRKGSRYQYINHVDETEYLISVVSHEMSPSWPIEALKAQAVVARTYLYQRQKTAGNSVYEVDSTTNSQVYKGFAKGDQNVRKAVAESQGEVVTYKNELAQVFFYSCAGGFTAAASEVWSADLPYLIAQKSEYCKGAPVYRWNTKFSKKELEAKLGIRNIRSISVSARTPSRRAHMIKIVTSNGTRTMRGTVFRSKMGATRVKSTLFGIRMQNGKIAIAGKGFGHGVGMDQWGTKFLVEKHGKSYKDVIAHYFPGTRVDRKSAGWTPS